MKTAHASNITVLIVDDQLLYRDTLSSILADEGFSLNAVTNGADALEAVRSSRPDLVLLDIDMPGMNGFDVCKAIKTTPDIAGTKVIFFSWQDDAETVVKGINLGANDFLSKGTPRREMLARILTHLREARHTRSAAQQWQQRAGELEHQIKTWHRTLSPLAAANPGVRKVIEQMASVNAARTTAAHGSTPNSPLSLTPLNSQSLP